MPASAVTAPPRPSFPHGGPSCLARAVAGVCLAGYVALLALCGADLLGAVRFFAAAGLYLVLPGWLLARRAGPRGCPLRLLLAPVYGCGLLAAVFCVSVRLGAGWLVHLMPPAVAAALLVWECRDRRAAGLPLRPRRRLRPGGAGLAAWGALCLLFALGFSARNAHPAAAGSIRLNRDLLWNAGNAEALLDAFPPQDIRFSGVRLSYHYLTELLAAALAKVSFTGCYDVLAFYAGPLFLLGELTALTAAGRIFYAGSRGSRRRARALPAVLFCFQCASLWTAWPAGNGVFGNTLLQHLVTNINAQATAVVFFAAFVGLFAAIARRKFRVGARWWAAWFLNFGLFTLAKGPQAALALCALAVAMVFVLLFQRPCAGRALLCLGGTAAMFLALYRLLYAAGANTSMQFSIFAMERTLAYQWLSPLTDWLCAHLPVSGYVWLAGIGVADTFLMLPFQFVLWLRGVPGALRRLPQLDPAHTLLHAGAVGGFLAYHLFWHESSSQVYFAFFGMLCMTVLAVEQLPRLRRLCPTAVAGWLCGAAGLCTAVCMVLALCRGGAAQLTRTAGLRPAEATADAATAGDEAAARWLRANAPAGTVFATDRTSSAPPPAGEDGISNLYTAFSGVQCYMEGWTYAVSNMGVPPAEVERRRALVAQLFDPDATAAAVTALCRQEGITCLVDCGRWPGRVTPQLVPAYTADGVAVYFLP